MFSMSAPQEMMPMYCPRCAAQNVEGAKFCRGCGAGFDAALAMLGRRSLPHASDVDDPAEVARGWAEKYGQGVRNVGTGVMLLMVSLLICVPLALFAPAEVPWVFVWVVFFGWLACWGGISLAGGVGELLEARSMLRRIAKGGTVPSAQAKLDAPTTAKANAAPTTSDLPSLLPPSVAENTTKLLKEDSPALR